ncbi:hypothetical protein ES705_50442 [subsurface metagenome]
MRRMQVMTLAQKGLPQTEIAAKVGVSAVRVNKILTASWRACFGGFRNKWCSWNPTTGLIKSEI